MLTLYPKTSHVKNIGMDNTATHGVGLINNYTNKLVRKKYIKINKLMAIKENIDAKEQIIKYFLCYKDSFLIKVLKKIYYILK
jgi:hypothetical protein